MIELFKAPLNFHEDIKTMIIEKNMSYIDAILFWCESNKIEPEEAALYIKENQQLESQVQIEAEDLNFLKKTGARLPL